MPLDTHSSTPRAAVAFDGARRDRRAARCLPDGVQGIRSITKTNVMDILHYTSSQHGQAIISAVHGSLEARFHEFLAERPGWNGTVSLVGHSLGSVICLDLLTHGGSTFQGVSFPRLPFRVTNFFALGSPAACFRLHEGR